jgi:hypothetical protein
MSQEQKEALKLVLAGFHVVVEALPGAGKSFLAELVCDQWPGQAMLLSYNNALVKETKKRLKSAHVYTFHGLASRLCRRAIHDDRELIAAFEDCEILQDFEDVELLIIDEIQDMRFAYYQFVRKFIKTCIGDIDKLQLLILGDTKQLLYSFFPRSHADERYLTHSSQIFNINKKTWKHVTLTTSFRSTAPVAEFINILTDRVMLPRPNTSNAAKVSVFVTDHYSTATSKIVFAALDMKRTNVVLCSSLNGLSNAKNIVAYLCEKGIRTHVTRSGQMARKFVSESDKHAVIFKTYHASKGLTFENVIVLVSDDTMNNSLYVALTRSSIKLTVIYHFSGINSSTFETLKCASCASTAQLMPIKRRKTKEEIVRTRFKACEMFSFLDAVFMSELSHMVECIDQFEALEFDDNEDYVFNVDNVSRNFGDLAGIALWILLEVRLTQKIPSRIFKLLKDEITNNNRSYCVDLCCTMLEKSVTVMSKLLERTDLSDSEFFTRSSKYAVSMAFAMDACVYAENLNYFNDSILSTKKKVFLYTLTNLRSLGKIFKTNIHTSGSFDHKSRKITISGTVRCIIDGTTLVDIVHVPSIEDTNAFDVLVNRAMLTTKGYECAACYVVNTHDGQVVKVTADIDTFITATLESRFQKKQVFTDSEFLQKHAD